MTRRSFISSIATLALLGCTAATHVNRSGHLSEEQIRSLIDHPQQWDGRTVTIRIYPYDRGVSRTYSVCFEPCDAEYARRSSFVIVTAPNRFSGYRGDRPVDVTAQYDSSCAYRDVICADTTSGIFTEVER